MGFADTRVQKKSEFRPVQLECQGEYDRIISSDYDYLWIGEPQGKCFGMIPDHALRRLKDRINVILRTSPRFKSKKK